jgi:RsiW-degrading membrane proteinase PrsW (M82 family)
MPSRPRENVLFTVIVTVLAALGALAMMAVIALSGAPTTMLIAAAAAAVPVGPVVACFLWLDRYEPEPKMLLAMGLAWGAFVATAGTLLIQGVGGIAVPMSRATQLAVAAPVVEEAAKGSFLLLLLWWRRAELDGVLDGIVYAGMVGVGFAFVENILYLAAAYNGTDAPGPGGVQALTSLFVVRCLFSPFAHPLFTSFTGIGIGIAVGSRSRAVRVLAPLVGYCCAVLAHALWNGSTLEGMRGFIGVYLLVGLPAFVGIALLAVFARRNERTMLLSSLGDAAARGLLPMADVPWLADLRGRRTARAHARRWGGETGLQAMRDYQRAAVELGFLHHRYLRGVAPPDYAARGAHYVTEIRAVRPYLVFAGAPGRPGGTHRGAVIS